MSGPPASGPCSPWVSAGEVKQAASVQKAVAALEKGGQPLDVDLDAVCAEMAEVASQALYELSGRVYSGECGPVTVRPLARPTDVDSRFAWHGGYGYNSSWGYANWYGAVPGVAMHYGSLNPPEIDLGAYPVTSIVQVKIDGVVIPPAEYELRDYKRLVRLRPTASSVPTDRYGWPTGQVQDLPDTQPGTFSVTYTYGQPPPELGKIAARKLAEVLTLPALGDDKTYPLRATAITRQGVTVQMTDVMDLLSKQRVGIYEVDLFLDSVNPNRNQRQAAVWSPDLGRPRRQANVSTS